MSSTRRRSWISLLILAHLVCLVGVAAWNSPRGTGQFSARDAVVFGFFWGELGLLAVWAGLGRGQWIPRLAVIWGLVCLVTVAPLIRTWWNDIWWSFAILLATLAVTVPLMLSPIVLTLAVVRRRGCRLVWFPTPPPAGGALQFSVRHMIALTAVVAVVMSAAYYARPLAVFEKDGLVSPGGISTGASLVVMAVVISSFLAAPLLAVWACLGMGRPGARLLVAGCFSLALGLLPGYCFGGQVSDYAVFGGGTVLQLAVIAGSLLLFRAVGYRVVRDPIEEVLQP